MSKETYIYKRQAISAAKELFYPEYVISQLKNAKTDAEIECVGFIHIRRVEFASRISCGFLYLAEQRQKFFFVIFHKSSRISRIILKEF